ncbi:MAG TPA: hypothetical protein PLQ50_01750 [Candidatus Woesebacteria bacterium]|nr:hypothetical protein [Candidatus Woesebacteria bacterium]
MPIFKYLVKNKQGENIKGKVEAISKNQAVSTLMGHDLFVIDVSPIGQKEGALSGLTGNKVKFEDLVNFTRQLATMINAVYLWPLPCQFWKNRANLKWPS